MVVQFVSVSIFDVLPPANMKTSPAHLAWLTPLLCVPDLHLYHHHFHSTGIEIKVLLVISPATE